MQGPASSGLCLATSWPRKLEVCRPHILRPPPPPPALACFATTGHRISSACFGCCPSLISSAFDRESNLVAAGYCRHAAPIPYGRRVLVPARCVMRHWHRLRPPRCPAGVSILDPVRCLRLGTYGLAVDGPFGHLWYKILDRTVCPDNPQVPPRSHPLASCRAPCPALLCIVCALIVYSGPNWMNSDSGRQGPPLSLASAMNSA